jgi:hypothetical protein
VIELHKVLPVAADIDAPEAAANAWQQGSHSQQLTASHVARCYALWACHSLLGRQHFTGMPHAAATAAVAVADAAIAAEYRLHACTHCLLMGVKAGDKSSYCLGLHDRTDPSNMLQRAQQLQLLTARLY